MPEHSALSSGRLRKQPTGVSGFDDATRGGLPVGRTSVLVGGPGTGKTVFALQAAANHVARGGSAVFVAFEETVARIRANAASFDWAPALHHPRLAFIDARLSLESVQAGAFDLQGLLAQIEGALALAAAKGSGDGGPDRGEGSDDPARAGGAMVVVDGIDFLLSLLRDPVLERRELQRLQEWTERYGATCLVTGKATGATTGAAPGDSWGDAPPDGERLDSLHYMADCLVAFEGGLSQSHFSRSIRIVKYRGSGFSTGACVAVIAGNGFNLVQAPAGPRIDAASSRWLTTGIGRLDTLLGRGYPEAGSVLVSGAPGTAKTTLAASFAAATVRRGERALFVSFDEVPARIILNMRSVGIELAEAVASGALTLLGLRRASGSPEEHLVAIREAVEAAAPSVLVIDPVSTLLDLRYRFLQPVSEALLSLCRTRGVTFLATSLLEGPGNQSEATASHISTIADVWIHLSYVAVGGERNRALTIVKARGSAHSNQVRELVLSAAGPDLRDVYSEGGEVLMGTARAERELAVSQSRRRADLAIEQRRFEMERAAEELAARAADLERQQSWNRRALELLRQEQAEARDALAADRILRRQLRRADL